jgi:hypothetical protein
MPAKLNANSLRLKKIQLEAKKLKKSHPKMTHIEAIKKAWAMYKKNAPAAKKVKTKTAVKKKIGSKKISEKTILKKIRSVKKGVKNLDEAQHAHMLGKIGESLLKRYTMKYTDADIKRQHIFKAYNLANAKTIAANYKKFHDIKGRVSVSKL